LGQIFPLAAARPGGRKRKPPASKAGGLYFTEIYGTITICRMIYISIVSQTFPYILYNVIARLSRENRTLIKSGRALA
jgi:hypothetical protein